MRSNSQRTPPQEMANCQQVVVASGSHLFDPGDGCQQFVFVVEGRLRVNLLSETGGEILLYRLGKGDTCVLTTSCLLGENDYSAQAIVEQDMQLLVMPKSVFWESLNLSANFRQFVFDSFSDRLAEMMAKIDEVTFQTINSRLAAALLSHQSTDAKLMVTHDQLAVEIGSAREVVSRKLAQWEKDGIILKGRGYLELTATEQLQRMAKQLP